MASKAVNYMTINRELMEGGGPCSIKVRGQEREERILALGASAVIPRKPSLTADHIGLPSVQQITIECHIKAPPVSYSGVMGAFLKLT
jgi:hypothetical protein